MIEPLNATPLATLIVAAMLGATAGLAHAQQTGSVQEGLKLASEVCSECHLVVKSPGRSTDPDAPTFATIANTKGVTRAGLFARLHTSHQLMPNIVIKGEDAQNIIAYILSLKEGD
jgi:mono/diheme cytochrome c family protein